MSALDSPRPTTASAPGSTWRLAWPAAWRARFVAQEPLLYAGWAATWLLASARLFYGFMMKQTGGEWSAPLDDVFIHFDYARATAQRHPFEWVAGNGYSSGNTSVAYPFVLAAGYLAGFTRERLMLWAALVATTSVFGVLLAARGLFTFETTASAPSASPSSAFFDRVAAYLLPPLFLGLGALDWTLWSGMEVAFFLATWALALAAYLPLVTPGARDPRVMRARAWRLGLAGALIVLTRPEGVTTIAAFGLSALYLERREPSVRSVRGVLGLAIPFFVPGVLVVLGLAVCNRVFTGEWSANGAIVKLAVYNPFLTREAKWDDYAFNFRYEIFRNLDYHFTDAPTLGCILPALALLALAVPKTRPVAVLLWAQILGWMALVAFNGQVRWQNERYTMPAVAWLLIAAALGASVLVRRIGRPHVVLTAIVGVVAAQAVLATRLPDARPSAVLTWAIALGAGAALAALLWLRATRVLAVVVALGLFHAHQAPRMRDQKWFFGRACRNIRDQHVETGRWLRQVHPRRILVGDAGAIIYASGRPGLDIIGLGGYHALPFARAGVQGLTATIELMEHLAPEDLPDVLAIYPGWWGILPTWFGGSIVARVPAVGNVICGGYEDVVYVADWHLLGTGEQARLVPPGLTVKDTVDVADLMSEKAHGYVFAAPTSGFTELKVLGDPADASKDLLDGGRELKTGAKESMRFTGLTPGRDATLLLRTAPVDDVDLTVRVNGERLPPVSFLRHDGWVEPAILIPGRLVGAETRVEITNDAPTDFVDYHAWVAQ